MLQDQRHLRRHCVVEEDIHASLVDFIDGPTPFLDVAIMGIEEGEIERLGRRQLAHLIRYAKGALQNKSQPARVG